MSKIKINIKDLFNIPTAVIYNPDSYRISSDVCIDSRNVKKDSIFFAIKGEKFDGHKFVKEAIKNGAGTIVINKNRLRYFDDISSTIVAVKNTILAYGDLANIVRTKADYKVISITGSNGKTSTKEMLSVLLAEKFKVVKTESNNNNHIGVPMTIFSAEDSTEILLLEHGTNHFGEIEYTSKIAEPNFALITNIGSSHLKFLENTEKVYEEKSFLFNFIVSDGKRFVNNDDKLIRSNTKKLNNKIIYGFKGKPDIKGTILSYNELGYPELSIEYGKRKLKTVLPMFGEVNAKNLLASVSIALELKLSITKILNGIKKLKPFNGRLNPSFIKDCLVIDDTYNSNPESVKAAVSVLKKIKKYKRKILILGDMFELGNTDIELHKSLAEIVKSDKKIELILIGKLMKELYSELKDMKQNIRHFASREKLTKHLLTEDFSNTVVLVKGSRGMKMEDFICNLTQHFGFENKKFDNIN